MRGDFQLGEWLVQPRLNRINGPDGQLSLEPKAMEVLVCLAEHPREVVPKDTIIRTVWADTFVTDSVLVGAISDLRKAFGDSVKDPRVIQTIPKRGYRLLLPVAGVPPTSSGRYRTVQQIGQGAMGEVYLAEDTLLNRQVALKFLQPDLEKDPVARQRLLREARAAAALDHPFICKVYDIGELDGRTFFAMEQVEGETLRERLSRGPLSLSEVLLLAVEVAEGLANASESGVIHRDIKPSNIFITKHGHAKIVDFGLAKLAPVEVTPSAGEDAATVLYDEELTGHGTTMGTVSYMSPEQIRGEKLDARTDIFSFGVVLYEMVTGKKPFSGPTSGSVLAAVLSDDPVPVSQLNPGAPAALERVIDKSLAKNRESRYRNASEMLSDLNLLRAQVNSDGAIPVDAARPRRVSLRRIVVSASIVLLLAAVILMGWSWYSSPRFRRLGARVTTTPLTSYTGHEYSPTFSPEGDRVAFAWNGEGQDSFDLWIQQIGVGVGSPRRLTSSEFDDFSPAWSPDGRYVAFIRELGRGRAEVRVIPSEGGPERRLFEVDASRQPSVAWSPDSRALAVAGRVEPGQPSALSILFVESGELRPLTSPDDSVADRFPAFSPDGRSIAFARSSSLFVSYIFLLDLTDDYRPLGEPRQLTFEAGLATHPVWTRDGQEIIYCFGVARTDQQLRRIPVEDSRRFRVLSFAPNALAPALSADGLRLAYEERTWRSDIYRVHLPEEADPALVGEVQGDRFAASTRWDVAPRYSPDGESVAFASERSGSREIWVCDREGKNPRQLTFFQGAAATFPSWSPDSRSLCFVARPEGQEAIFIVSAEGGTPTRLISDSSSSNFPSWSADGSWIYFQSNRSGSRQIWKIPVAGGESLQVTEKGGVYAVESLDGRLLYFSRGSELWSLPVAGGTGQRVLEQMWGSISFQITPGGIYYMSPGATGDSFVLRWFDFSTGVAEDLVLFPESRGNFSVSPDGQWLLYSLIEQLNSDLILVENFR